MYKRQYEITGFNDIMFIVTRANNKIEKSSHHGGLAACRHDARTRDETVPREDKSNFDKGKDDIYAAGGGRKK